MKAVRIHEFGGAGNLRLDEIETPQPGADEVLIKTAVAGINFADTMLRSGTYLMRPPLPYTIGFEVAGTIEKIGGNAGNWQVGQRVLAAMQGGGYAEYAVAKAATMLPLPDELDFAKATVILAQGSTALGLLKNFQAGQTILIHAAAGGMGTLLVQLAKQRGAKTIIGTASSPEKLEIARRLGADHAINYTENNWTEQVLNATGGRGVDLLIEMVGGRIGKQNLKVLADGGTMIVYGQASNEDFSISARELIGRSHTVKGYKIYDETPETMIKFAVELTALVNNSQLEVLVQKFPLEQAAEAHRAIENRKTTGKVVLTVE